MPRLPWSALAVGEVTGIKPWGQGINTNPEIVDKKDGVVKMSGYEDGLNVIVGNITEQKHKNVYCEEYALAPLAKVLLDDVCKCLNCISRLGNSVSSVVCLSKYRAVLS